MKFKNFFYKSIHFQTVNPLVPDSQMPHCGERQDEPTSLQIQQLLLLYIFSIIIIIYQFILQFEADVKSEMADFQFFAPWALMG